MSSLPRQFEVTEQEMWAMYVNDELKDFITLDHILLAKKKIDDTPVWVRVSN